MARGEGLKIARVMLVEPGQIGKIHLKNRMIMAPMVTSYAAPDGSVTPRMIDYYAERARGGASLVMVEAAYPCSGGYPGRLSLHDDKFIPGLKQLVAAVHQARAAVGLQVNPGRGRVDEVIAASASEGVNPESGRGIRALELAEIDVFLEQFGQGVRRAREAGFDAVQIHAANGYLVAEFLSPLTNRRVDAYGGSLEKRARFALQLVEVAKREAGEEMAVYFRLGADEHLPGGLAIEEAVTIARLLEKAGVEAIDVVSGAADSHEWIVPPMSIARGCNLYLAAAIKKAVGIPVSVAGRIKDPETAEAALRGGKADFISLGRSLIADPYFCLKVIQGREEDIRPCIACNECYERTRVREPIVCSVNYNVGREGESLLRPAQNSKKRVAVIGGGPAGLEAASVCARRGYSVTLYEKRQLGGVLREAGVPDFKKELRSLVAFLVRQVEQLPVQIVYSEFAPGELAENYEVALVAIGGSPATLPVQGADQPNVVNALQVLRGEVEVGAKVLIVGGGLVGAEVGLHLAQKGKQVTIIEMLDEFMVNVDKASKKIFSDKFKELETVIYPGKRLKSIRGNIAEVEDKQGNPLELCADTIVLATGFSPRRELGNTLKALGLEVHELGDCLRPGKILDAIQGAYSVGLNL